MFLKVTILENSVLRRIGGPRHTLSTLSFFINMFNSNGGLSRYLDQAQPTWAIVTGASDGIGLGFAQELSEHGFNIILHGRNPSKLQTFKESLEKQYPDRKYKTFVHDAETELTDEVLSQLEAILKDIHLTILINNVGGPGSVKPSWQPFISRSLLDIDKYINLNTRFSTQLTRILLPHLIKNAPGFILNMSSFGGILPSAYATVYAGTKAYNLAWSSSLKAEMKAENIDIDVLAIMLSKTQSNTVKAETGFFVPSSRDLAKGALAEAGCGKAVVTPAWGHAIQQFVLNLLPTGLLEAVLVKAAKAQKLSAEKERGEHQE